MPATNRKRNVRSAGARKTRKRAAQSRAKAAPGKRAAAANRRIAGRPAPAAPEITATNLNKDDRKFLRKFGKLLSKSTLRAKWIHDPGEHADRNGQTLATRSREVIQQWAAERGGEPATVARRGPDDRPRVLRIDFPGFGGGGKLEHITWEEWFGPFDERNLVFLYQETMRDGNQSNFFRIDRPTRESD